MNLWEEQDNSDCFAAAVANPPYQIEISPASANNEATVIPIFHEFQKIANIVSNKTCFIYPGERWVLQSGKGLADFGREQINDPSLQHLFFFPYSHSLFQGARLSDGVTVVFKNKLKDNQGVFTLTYGDRNNEYYTAVVQAPGVSLLNLDPRVNLLVEKINKLRLPSITHRKYAQKAHGIESNFAELFPEKLSKTPVPGWIEIITNDKAGKGGRATKFWIQEKDIPRHRELVHRWKIVASSMNLTGINGRCPTAEILPPGSTVGRVKLILADFATQKEALNFFAYLSSSIGRFFLASSGDTQTNFGLNLPDLESYKKDSSIDFFSKLDEQLAELFGLTSEELVFIKQWVEDNLAGYSLVTYDRMGNAIPQIFIRPATQHRSH